jgi:Lon-like ATP-dependent protease
VVFEQSYQESEGDSASLAILLAVISCYSQQPLAQNLFVTGALDQHGNVLAIGGINQKISAVTRLFHLGLLNESVTILIPQANQINLVLEEDTLQLINAQKINIFGINHCQEAFPLAMSLSCNKVIQIINQRISSLHKDEGDNQVFGIFNRFIHLFK